MNSNVAIFLFIALSYQHNIQAMDNDHTDEPKIAEFTKRLHFCLFGGVKHSIAGLNKGRKYGRRVHAYKPCDNGQIIILRCAFAWIDLNDEELDHVEQYMEHRDYGWFVLEQQNVSISQKLKERGYVPALNKPLALTKFILREEGWHDGPSFYGKLDFDDDTSIKVTKHALYGSDFKEIWCSLMVRANGSESIKKEFNNYIEQLQNFFTNKASGFLYVGYRNEVPISTCIILIKKSKKKDFTRAYLGHFIKKLQEDDLCALDEILFKHAMRDAQAKKCNELWMVSDHTYGANLPKRSAMNFQVYQKSPQLLPLKVEKNSNTENPDALHQLIQSVSSFFGSLFADE